MVFDGGGRLFRQPPPVVGEPPAPLGAVGLRDGWAGGGPQEARGEQKGGLGETRMDGDVCWIERAGEK